MPRMDDESSQDCAYSDVDFTDPPEEKDSFNKSMLLINENWSPLKFQLRQDIESVDERTKRKVCRKTRMAVDEVIARIAPGQVDSLRDACFSKTAKESEDLVLSSLKHAITEAIFQVLGRSFQDF